MMSPCYALTSRCHFLIRCSNDAIWLNITPPVFTSNISKATAATYIGNHRTGSTETFKALRILVNADGSIALFGLLEIDRAVLNSFQCKTKQFP
jgi:hypothetical protein